MKTQNTAEFPTRQEFVLGRTITDDGCVMTDIEDVVAHAKHCSTRRDGQKIYGARYFIKIDGEQIFCSVERLLRRNLSCIAVGSRCEVFRNGNHGCTINFDRFYY
jgi:hypothetical protein